MVQKEPRPRGRPRSFDPAQALQRARDAFWNQGFAATSLDDLSAATGLNRPSLYAAFGDKHALYVQALEATRAEMRAGLARAMSLDEGLREALGRVYAAAIGVYLSGEAGPRGCFLIGTGVTESVEDPQIRAAMSAGIADVDHAFQTRLTRAQAEGELPAGRDPAALAKVATAVLNTLAIRARTGADRETLEAIAASAVALICG